METYDCQGGAIFDPRGMIGRIYVKLYIRMLHTNYKSFVTCCFRDCVHVFPIVRLLQIMKPPGRGVACINPRGTFSSIYN